MGSSSSKKKNKGIQPPQVKEADPKGKQMQEEPQPNPSSRLRPRLMTKPFQLRQPDFREEALQTRDAMLEHPHLKKLITGEVWHMKIGQLLLQQLSEQDLLRHIWCSYGRALVLQMSRQEMTMAMAAICSEDQRQWPFPIPIYRSLFAIKFATLRKIKLKGSPKETETSIVSLYLLQYVDAPYMEELLADDHALTSLGFLRKCYWPRLSHLSLRNTFVADCHKLATTFPSLSNNTHIQEINIACSLSEQWVEVSWILKMGFVDAKEQAHRQQTDDKYWEEKGGCVLRRVDMDVAKIRNRSKHVEMIKKKFNNGFFENPLSLW